MFKGTSRKGKKVKQEKKVYKDWSDTETLVKCKEEDCGGFAFEQELEENDWKCPHCGKPIAKPD
jgi:acetyl-CoA carboxylase beta subunit